MRQFAIGCKVQWAAALITLSLSGSLTAGQIDSVCKTDDETLNSIKSNPDQTLWVFMQTICQDQFVITQSPVRPQPLAISPAAAEITPLNSEVSVIPLSKVDSLEHSTQNPDGIGANGSQAKAVTVRIEAESSTEQNSLKVEPQPSETNEPAVSLAKEEKNSEQTRVEIVAKVEPDRTAPNQGMHETQTGQASNVQLTENRDSNDNGYRSNRPWLYSLLGPQVSGPLIEDLPPPIEYKPNKFSNYKPDYLSGTTASNHGNGYLQKPEVMSVTPHGFFASFYWHSYEEPGFMEQNGPGFALGFVDERAIREWSEIPGMGSRAEVGKIRMNYKGSGEFTSDAYYFLGELYKPLASGLYVGLGYRRLNDRKDPVQISSISQILSTTGYLMYNRLSEYLYLPIGIAGRIGKEATYKVQLNALIKGQQTSALGRIGDGNIKNNQNSGWGIDLAYAPSSNGELFLRYWSVKDSEVVIGPRTRTPYMEPKNETIEGGIRYWW